MILAVFILKEKLELKKLISISGCFFKKVTTKIRFREVQIPRFIRGPLKLTVHSTITY